MSIEVLNVDLVRDLIDKNGWHLQWVIKQIGEKQHFGYILLREGTLPKDQARKARVLRELSKLLKVGVGELLLTLSATKAS